MKRKAIASFVLVVLFLVSVFPMSISSGAVDSANDLRFTSERTSLNNERIDGQAKIVEHRITTSELEKMKREIGVYEKGRNYNQIINGHGTGLRPPTEEEWAQIAANANIVETVSLGSVNQPPSRVDNSNSSWFPPIGNQDGEGSCTCWAVGYYTKTFQEAKERGWNLSQAKWEDGGYAGYGGYPDPAYQDRIISPDFIYHLINGGVDNGSMFDDAINLVCGVGACSWKNMPPNSSDVTTWPSENAWREAAYYRGASTGYEEMWVNTDGGILSLKNLIASENLAVIGVNATQYSGQDSVLTPNDVWTVDNYTGGINHANTIVGYDDNFPYSEGGSWSKGAFKIANSWGVGWYGERVPDGFYWISYKAMSQIVGYVMFYRDRIGYLPTLTSSFRIEHPLRGECNITIGMGTHDNPNVTKSFTNYIRGGDQPFYPNNIVFDITEFKDVVPNVLGQPFFMRVYDGGTPATGTILYFAVENTVSSNPPVTTVNGGYVFTDLILGAYIDWWPMFHHDLDHTGYSTSNAPTTNQTLWTYTTGRVLSSPTIAGGIVYIGSYDRNVYALNAYTGAFVWSYTTGGQVVSSPAVADGIVYVGSLGGNVYAFGGVYDVAVTNVASSKTVVGQGFSASINVTVADQGSYAETFNVTTYANATSVASQNVTLSSGSSTTITFTWNTTSFAKGNYTLSAYAEPVPGETSTADNNYTRTVPVHVGVPGDVSGTTPGVYDGVTSMKDIAYLVSLYQTKPTKPNWNPNADVNNDGVVDMKDIAIAIYYFNQHE